MSLFKNIIMKQYNEHRQENKNIIIITIILMILVILAIAIITIGTTIELGSSGDNFIRHSTNRLTALVPHLYLKYYS